MVVAMGLMEGTHISTKLADMEIRIPKTEAMLVRKDVRKDNIEVE